MKWKDILKVCLFAILLFINLFIVAIALILFISYQITGCLFGMIMPIACLN